jgi:uncharacterized protein
MGLGQDSGADLRRSRRLIAVDTNILVYAHRRDSVWHQPAASCVRSLAEARAAWTIPWPCIHEFLAVVTNLRIYVPPSTLDEAIAQVEGWLESPSLRLIAEGADHWNELISLARRGKIVGGQFHDAKIAAICLQHGVGELWSADRDFSYFPSADRRIDPSTDNDPFRAGTEAEQNGDRLEFRARSAASFPARRRAAQFRFALSPVCGDYGTAGPVALFFHGPASNES